MCIEIPSHPIALEQERGLSSRTWVQFPAPLPSYHLLVDQALGAHTYIHTASPVLGVLDVYHSASVIHGELYSGGIMMPPPESTDEA